MTAPSLSRAIIKGQAFSSTVARTAGSVSGASVATAMTFTSLKRGFFRSSLRSFSFFLTGLTPRCPKGNNHRRLGINIGTNRLSVETRQIEVANGAAGLFLLACQPALIRFEG